MVDHIFRQYDIRAKIGSELRLDEVYDIARAIAYYFKSKNPSIKTVAVGADGRTHSPAMKADVCRALQESGLDVVFVGVCPSPVVYFSQFTLPVDAGLMITASHNGPEYNGIKICLNKESVWGQEIQEIKELVKHKKALKAENPGSYREHDLIEEYTDWLKNHFPHLVNMPLRAVIDCGNGAAGTVLPRLIKKMDWKDVQLLYPEVDGTYPNHEADPTVPENMEDVKKLMSTGSFDVGLGLDGDCDRMVPMTATGELVSGDKTLALFSQSIVEQNPGCSIVFDIKCSSGLPELLEKWGGTPCMSPSGHSIIKNQMKQNGALLAGELSCHFFFADRYFGYDDGIYAAMRLFEYLMQEQKPLHELLEMFPKKWNTPEIRMSCDQDQMNTIIESVKERFAKRDDISLMTIDGVRATMKDGWGMVRSSNTQPVICLRFEANSPERLDDIKKDFADALQPFFSKDDLMKHLCY